MKKIGAIIIAILSFWGCDSSETTVAGQQPESVNEVSKGKKFSIKIAPGALDTLTQAVVQVKEIGARNPQTGVTDYHKIAEVEYKADKGATLTGHIPGPGLYKINVDGWSDKVVLLTPSDLSISLDFSKEASAIQLVGSEENDKFQTVVTYFMNQAKKEQELQQKALALGDEADFEALSQEFLVIHEEKNQELKNRIEALSPSYVSLFSMDFLNPSDHRDFYIDQWKMYQEVEDEELKDAATQKLAPMVEYLKSLVVIGDPAPDFEMTALSGKQISLSSFKGKYVLLDFWANWCGPCKRELPNLKEAYNKYHNKGFEILGVSLDRTEDEWKYGVKQLDLPWNHVCATCDGNQAPVLEDYMVSSIPKTFLLDKDGVVIATDLRGNQLEEKLKSLLK